MVIPKISPKLGPEQTGDTVPPLAVTVELTMDIPAMEPPLARLLDKVEYY